MSSQASILPWLWAGGGLACALAWMGLASGSGGTEPEPPPDPVNTELGTVLFRAGLDAEALAAAGVTSAEVADVAADAATWLAANPGALAEADADYAEAKLAHDRLVRKVRSGRASPAEVSLCAQLRDDIETAKADREASLDSLFQAGTADRTADSLRRLQRIRANRDWYMDLQYLVVDRSEASWVELGDALDTRRIAQKYGGPFPQGVQDFLASVEADSEIAAAKVSLDTNLAAVQAAWNVAVSE